MRTSDLVSNYVQCVLCTLTREEVGGEGESIGIFDMELCFSVSTLVLISLSRFRERKAKGESSRLLHLDSRNRISISQL